MIFMSTSTIGCPSSNESMDPPGEHNLHARSPCLILNIPHAALRARVTGRSPQSPVHGRSFRPHPLVWAREREGGEGRGVRTAVASERAHAGHAVWSTVVALTVY